MKIQVGEFLISNVGDYYRVVECQSGVVSLMRVNGYTLFSCSQSFVEMTFRPVSLAIGPCSSAA